jgi:hypothetical protein
MADTSKQAQADAIQAKIDDLELINKMARVTREFFLNVASAQIDPNALTQIQQMEAQIVALRAAKQALLDKP